MHPSYLFPSLLLPFHLHSCVGLDANTRHRPASCVDTLCACFHSRPRYSSASISIRLHHTFRSLVQSQKHSVTLLAMRSSIQERLLPTFKYPAVLTSPTWSLTRFLYLAFFVIAATYAALLLHRFIILKRRGSIVDFNAEDDDDEDDSELEQESYRLNGFVAGGKERQALRRMLGKNASKRASVIRIVSSDPTSALCDNPMQLELDPTGRRTFWPSSPNLQGTAKEVIVPEPRSSSLSTSPNPSRRRTITTARLSIPTGTGRSLSASPGRSGLHATGAGASLRPGRPRSFDSKAVSRTGSTASSRSRLAAVPTSDDVWIDNVPVVEDEDTVNSTASTPNMARAASEQSGRFPSAVSDDSEAFLDLSPGSSVISLQRLPSILKDEAQTFRTASLRDIDISSALISQQSPVSAGFAEADAGQMFGMGTSLVQPNSNFVIGGLTAPPPYSPAAVDMDRLNHSWSQARKRQVRLVEPDWQSHVDSHVRARERLEAATRFSHFKRSNSVDTHLNRITDWAKSSGEERSVQPDFWFERFTQSTAAAGRDWDWRKRRARLQRAAAIGAALNQTAFGVVSPLSSPLGANDSQIKQPMPSTESTLRQAQSASSPRRTMPSAPLITFTPQETPTAPRLSIDIDAGRVPVRKPAPGFPTSPTPSGSETPMGGIFGTSEVSMRLAEAARIAQRRRRRASEDGSGSPIPSTVPAASSNLSRPPLNSSSSSSSLIKGMNRVMRLKSPTEPRTAPLNDNNSSPMEERESSPLRSSFPPGIDSSVRVSSLGSLGRKISRSGSRHESERAIDAMQYGAKIELVESSQASIDDADSKDDEQAAYERSLMKGQVLEQSGFRSSADTYSPPASRLAFRTSPERRLDKLSDHRASAGSGTHNNNGSMTSLMARTDSVNSKGSDSKRTLATDVSRQFSTSRVAVKSESDSIGRGSSSNSSQKDSISSTSSPPVAKRHVKSGSRSSIMRSSNVARSEIDKHARTRTTGRTSTSMPASSSSSSLASPPGSRPGSRKGSALDKLLDAKHEQAPDPVLQPEPAPRGMAYRARSASLSSNSSSAASGSRRSSRSNSIREGQHPGGFAGLALAMTSSTPGSPEGGRASDPFVFTAVAPENAS